MIQGFRIGFLLGGLEGLWEIVLDDLVALHPLPSWDLWMAKKLGLIAFLYSGTLWGLAGAMAAAILRNTRQAQNILWRSLFALGLITFASHLFEGAGEWTTPIWWLRNGSCLVAGWFLGGVIQRLVSGWVGLRPQLLELARWSMRWIPIGMAVGWAALVLLHSGWTLRPRIVSSSISDSPNVLLLVVDSLRADHLSLYGYPKKITPSIDAFAQEGAVVFEDCQAQATWTSPSVASFITGKLFPRGDEQHVAFSEATLCERFFEVGYQVGWFVANPHLMPEYGFPQKSHRIFGPQRPYLNLEKQLAVGRMALRFKEGPPPLSFFSSALQRWASVVSGTWYRPWWIWDAELGDAFLAWLIRLPPDQPWMAYLHFMAPHSPYGDTRGESRNLNPPNEKHGGIFFLDRPARNPQELAPHRAGYDADIRYTDRCIGQILAVLRERGDLQKTAVVITADHGEEFGEHGWVGHTHGFHRGVTHVPLILRIPGIQGTQRVKTPVQLLDLVPTLLALCQLPPDPAMAGANLMEISRGGFVDPSRSLYHGHYHIAGKRAYGIGGIRRGAYQLYAGRTEQGIQKALYDLSRDPEERVNLVSKKPELASQLFTELTKVDPYWPDD